MTLSKQNLADIYVFVVAECRNGCTDVPSAVSCISRRRPEWVDTDGPVIGYALARFLETLNFAAIRENSETIYPLIA